MVNSLTRSLGATFGPIVLETLVKHYFERLRKEAPDGKNTTKLRQDELLYDQAFNLVKVCVCDTDDLESVDVINCSMFFRIFSRLLHCESFCY